MRRQFPGWLEHINEHGRPPGFSEGGMVGGSLGDALLGAGQWMWDLVSKPGQVIGDMFDRFLSGIGDSLPAKVVVGAAKSGAAGLASWIKDTIFGGGVDGAPSTGPGGPMPWQSIWALVKAIIPGAVMTSNYRPGARTAGYGTTSLHALGRAVDFVSPNMRGATQLLSMLKGWTELIHTPAGMWQQSAGRRFAAFAPITKQMHYDHVHVGMADGGRVPASRDYDALATKMLARGPLVRDVGGPIPPGDWWVRNSTGHTEWVMDPRVARAAQGPRGPQRIVGELEMVNGKAYIRGVIEDSPREVAIAGAHGARNLGSRLGGGGGL